MNASQVVEQLDELREPLIRKVTSNQPILPRDLSEDALKLAVLCEMLTSHVSASRKVMMDKEAELYKKHKDEMSATLLKEHIRIAIRDERIRFEFLENKQRNMWRLLDMVRTHIASERQNQDKI